VTTAVQIRLASPAGLYRLTIASIIIPEDRRGCHSLEKFSGSSQESVGPTCFVGFSVFAVFPAPSPGSWRGLSSAFMGPFGGISDHDCGVHGVRLSSARREGVPICRSAPRPAFPSASLARLLQRTNTGRESFEEICQEERTSIPLGISILRAIR